MNRCAFVFILLTMAGCGSPDLISMQSVAAKQPKVMSVTPAYKSLVTKDSSVNVKFSIAIDPDSINKYSFLVIKDFQDIAPTQVKKDLDAGKLSGVEGDYNVDDSMLGASFKPLQPFEAGSSYAVIVSTDVYTPDNFPFNQTPGSDATPFISTFQVMDEQTAQAISASDASGSDASASDPASLDTGADDTGTTPTQQPAVHKVVINEIYYDAVGSDTNGDLFVELKGAAGDSVAGYKLVFVNGDDGKITATINLPSGAKIPANGLYVVADAIDGNTKVTHIPNANFIYDFDPQNGPDAVQLIDSKGSLADAVCYGQVKATAAENKFIMCEGSFGPDAPSGQSISRLVDADDTDDNANDFVINTVPTPGSTDVQSN